MFDLTGATLGQLLAAANVPPPPVPVAPAPVPTPLPPEPPPNTPAEIDGYGTQVAAYQAYQAYLAQLAAYNNTVLPAQLEVWTSISQIILNYINQTAEITLPVPATGIKDGYGQNCTGSAIGFADGYCIR